MTRVTGTGLRRTTGIRNVKDSVGREGVAVTRGSRGVREELIFDGRTHVFLGGRLLDEQGRTVGTSAVLVRAVVDKAGRRP
ncbi:hypothetical protein [Streptomyces brasiliensis]|uniref:Uncharacterized protein n=1 Tax=Streptomyces brasiliensis TaxID=1954 RepID=A0A917LC50_9ACTN|nr:hypothetical protein [Streptomyces brasiliensis]GGJ57286.1 hypothetical protein GCM10010121_079930 [Streptomyces brasiliensis]